MKYARRQDRNHAEIRAEFKRLGCSWCDTYELGNGRPDGFVGLGGISMGIEIKDGLKPPSARRLTPDEKGFREYWTGGIKTVESKEDCAAVVTIMETWLEKIRR